MNKAYAYTPGGQRLAQYTPGTTATNLGYYTYNDHNDVEAVTGSTQATGGATTATYGYTAYGQPDPSQFTGADKNNTQPGAAAPFNPYRSVYECGAARPAAPHQTTTAQMGLFVVTCCDARVLDRRLRHIPAISHEP